MARSANYTPVLLSIGQAAIVALTLASLCRPAAADGYSYSTIVIPDSISGFQGYPTPYTEANGINSANTVVGEFSSNAGNVFFGYTDQAGSIVTLPRPPNSASDYVQANGINNSGFIVGTTFIGNRFGNQTYGYSYSGGVITTISDPSAVNTGPTTPTGGTSATAVNNAGAIAGFYVVSSAYTRYPTQLTTYAGFVDAGGVFSTIAVPGATNSYVNGITMSAPSPATTRTSAVSSTASSTRAASSRQSMCRARQIPL